MGLWRALAIAAATLIGVAAGAPARAQSPLEFQVKAAFITKFAAFVSWPATGRSAGALRICVQGDDPVGDSLLTANGQLLGERAVSVRRLSVVERDSGCDVLYAAGSAGQTPAQALQALQGAPVLTVTDAIRGPARGMIHFVVFQNRVRFHIDASQAARSGLSMNSKLLALALSVKR